MKTIPFRISARTARLIGRQNFPNTEGAVIELVKNSYDADATLCIVIFDNKYSTIPEHLTWEDFHKFSKEEREISNIYSGNPKTHLFDLTLSSEDEKKTTKISSFFQAKCRILIIDNGEGMTDEIIEKYWMTIGTENKENDYISNKGRIKTGAKGIGRFALDKLGDKAEMITFPDHKVYKKTDKNISYYWEVDWREFEGAGKTLDQIESNLIDLSNQSYSDLIKNPLSDFLNKRNETDFFNKFQNGTTITIKNLRDNWSDHEVNRIFRNLEVLIPPKEERPFKIFLFSTLDLEKYGEIPSTICDDFDYKVVAKANEFGEVEIEIFRNEFDLKGFPEKFFERPQFQKENFTKNDFIGKSIKINKTTYELTQGLKDIDEDNVLKNIGGFEFTFYFMKASMTKSDGEVFHYKDFNAAARRSWFSQFGGIKIYRDNFRVRPYGEVNSPSFDWLQLGERAARSPSSIGQQGRGGWLVRPNQISGTINISRLTNLQFEDTSSRYGLQENRAFNYFSELIIGLLKVFENDRTTIGRELRKFYDETHEKEKKTAEASAAKKRINRKRSKSEKSQDEKDAETLLDYSEILEEKIDELIDEGSLLRILASNGLVIASFTHELKGIQDHLGYRIQEVKKYLEPVVEKKKLSKLENYENPFEMLSEIEHEDKKLREWLIYSLQTLRKDKRTRKEINLIEYLDVYKQTWEMACNSRGIKLDVNLPKIKEIKIRFFEAELDSILNNLIINSMDAFKRSGAPLTREILITVSLQGTDLLITYKDSGPGLSKEITDPDSIFEPFVTTKRDPFTGKEIGYGLGLWIVNRFVNENNGEVKIIEVNDGFGISMIFFEKYHE